MFVKDVVCRFGRMDQSTKATGEITKLLVMDDLYMQMVMFIMGHGKMTKLTDMEFILI